MNSIARLEELLDSKDEEIEALEKEKRELEHELSTDWDWSKHSKAKESELPVPRLEIKLTVDDDGFKKTWDYGLIYRHTIGNLIFIPIGGTKLSGGYAITESEFNEESIYNELPFRDGVHIRRDMIQLNLPAFAVFNGKAIKLEGITDAVREDT